MKDPLRSYRHQIGPPPLPTDENRSTKAKRSWQSDLAQWSPSLGFGIQLAGSMLVYVLAGYLLDRWLDTAPWFILIGSAIGMVAFFMQVARMSRKMSNEGGKNEAEEKESDKT